MDVLENEPKKRKKMKVEEKAALLLLFVISVLGVVFGFKSFPVSLSRPFQEQMANYTGEKVLSLSEQEAAQIEEQKKTDTDEDGLVDYDELYVYKTSPYLSDSDSDGFDDKTEIFSNHNPNCPEGKDCLTASVAGLETPTEAGSGQAGFLSGIFNTSEFSDASFQSADDIKALFTQMGASEVRSILISQGVPKEQVDAMTNDQVMALLQSSLIEAEASGQFEEILDQDGSTTSNSTLTEEAAGVSNE